MLLGAMNQALPTEGHKRCFREALFVGVVWRLVSHDRVDHVTELSGDGRDGDPVSLSLRPLLLVEGLELGVELAGAFCGKPDGAPGIGRSRLRYG